MPQRQRASVFVACEIDRLAVRFFASLWVELVPVDEEDNEEEEAEDDEEEEEEDEFVVESVLVDLADTRRLFWSRNALLCHATMPFM